jgi:hypothetical protein
VKRRPPPSPEVVAEEVARHVDAVLALYADGLHYDCVLVRGRVNGAKITIQASVCENCDDTHVWLFAEQGFFELNDGSRASAVEWDVEGRRVIDWE